MHPILPPADVTTAARDNVFVVGSRDEYWTGAGWTFALADALAFPPDRPDDCKALVARVREATGRGAMEFVVGSSAAAG